jgi:hypothetical protein
MALPSARKLREHIRDLSLDMGVTIVVVGDLGYTRDVWGQALSHPFYPSRKNRVVLLSHRPVTPRTYMVAMHELGHCASGDGWSHHRMLEREAAAWEWALDNAILPLSLASHLAIPPMRSYRMDEHLAQSERFERLYSRVRRNSRPRRRKR